MPLFLTTAIAVSLVATGCAGGNSAAVAHLGRQAGPGSKRLTAVHLTGLQEGIAHSECMRAHGVAAYPDPDAEGDIRLSSSSGVNPSSSQFLSAQKACARFEPGGSTGSITPWGQALLEKALKFVACMRAHGIPNFPDPKPLPYGVMLTIPRSSGINVNSPQFAVATKVCQPLMNVNPSTGKP
jgi:hypothetical protein